MGLKVEGRVRWLRHRSHDLGRCSRNEHRRSRVGRRRSGHFTGLRQMTKRKASSAERGLELDRVRALLQLVAGLSMDPALDPAARRWAAAWSRARRNGWNGRLDELLQLQVPWSPDSPAALQELSARRSKLRTDRSRRRLDALVNALSPLASRRFLMARAFRPGDLEHARSAGRWGYRELRLRKPNGSWRVIHAPAAPLKRLQRKLLEVIAPDLTTRMRMLGVLPAQSVAAHALSVAGADTVICLDLRDFYPSVTRGAIEQGFRLLSAASPKGRAAGVQGRFRPASSLHHRPVGDFVSGLATRRGCLPQGAPTSPLLASVAFAPFDVRIRRALQQTYGKLATYSRYADDLVIGLATSQTSEGSNGPIGEEAVGVVRHALRGGPFSLNEDKTEIGSLGSIAICGLRPVKHGSAVELDLPAVVHREVRGQSHALRSIGLAGAADRWWKVNGEAFLKNAQVAADRRSSRLVVRRLGSLAGCARRWIGPERSCSEFRKQLAAELALASGPQGLGGPIDGASLLVRCAYLEWLVGYLAYLEDVASHPSVDRVRKGAARLRAELREAAERG